MTIIHPRIEQARFSAMVVACENCGTRNSRMAVMCLTRLQALETPCGRTVHGWLEGTCERCGAIHQVPNEMTSEWMTDDERGSKNIAEKWRAGGVA